MSGIRLLVSDWHGVYIPQRFAEDYDMDQWNIKDYDAEILRSGPNESNESYWYVWDNVIDNAEYTDENGNVWRLTQDGDLWAYCVELMDDDEYENFFGEMRENA